MFGIKRVYEKPDKNNGIRILVDRLWPRGVSKDKAKIDLWMREIAPSDSLRKWFGHNDERWKEFKRRYFIELNKNADVVKKLQTLSKNKTVTLLFAAKDREKNNAAVLFDFLKER